MPKKLCEISAIDIRMVRDFLEVLKDGDLVKFDSGVLTTPGCEGDHGCCAKLLDLQGLMDELDKAV